MRWFVSRIVLSMSLAAVGCLSLAIGSAAAAPSAPLTQPAGTAPDAPGSESYFDLALTAQELARAV